MNTLTLKTCYNCKMEKAISDYNRMSKSKDGYQSYCRCCEKEKKKRYLKGGDKYHIKMANSSRNSMRLRKSTPSWSNKEKIAKIYDLCVKLGVFLRQDYHAGHIFPIAGKLANGLNIAPNLQPELGCINVAHKNNFIPCRYCEGKYYELEDEEWTIKEKPTWNPSVVDIQVMFSSY